MFYFSCLKNLLEDELKTAKQNLRDMEQMFCESEITIAQLLTENKELEELLQMQDEFYSKAVGLQMNKSAEEKVIKLRKQMRELELRFVSHFHKFSFTDFSPST